MKLIRERWGLNAEVVAEMRFDIPNMYKFHTRKSVDVAVDLIRIFWVGEEEKHEEVDSVATDVFCNEKEHIGKRDEQEYEEEDLPIDLSGHT
jgi:hypothetical protein